MSAPGRIVTNGMSQYSRRERNANSAIVVGLTVDDFPGGPLAGMDLQREFGIAFLFISHDMAVVERVSHRVAVMYLGTLCELASKENLYGDPQHPYSRALLSAIPKLGRKGFAHIRLKGEVPTPIHLPTGCVFHTRCPHTDERCRREIPALRDLPNGSQAACHALEEGRI